LPNFQSQEAPLKIKNSNTLTVIATSMFIPKQGRFNTQTKARSGKFPHTLQPTDAYCKKITGKKFILT